MTPEEERLALEAKLRGTPSPTDDGTSFRARLEGQPAYSDRSWGDAFRDTMDSAGRARDFLPLPPRTALAPPPPEKLGPPASLAYVSPTEPPVSTPVVSRPVESPGGAFTRPLTLKPELAQVGRPAGPAGVNPLRQAFLDAQKRQLGTLGEQQEQTADMGAARAGRIEAVSGLQMDEAERQRQLADDHRRIEEEATAKVQAFQDRTAQQAEEIASRSFDPSSLVRNAGTGMQFAMAIGAVAGGMLAAVNGGPNQYMQDLHRVIDRAVEQERTTLENKRFAVGARQTIASQMMQQTGDLRLSLASYRQSLLEAAKTTLQAQTASLGIPEERAKTSIEVNTIQQQIDGLNVQNTSAAWKLYQQQAAAGVAAQRAAEERAWQRYMDVTKLGLEGDKVKIEAAKAGVGGNGLSKEDGELLRSLQAGYQGVEEALPAFQKGRPGTASAGEGPAGSKSVLVPFARAVPGTDAMAYRQQVEEWNARATLLLGPVVHTMNRGKPGAVELHDLQERVLIEPGMPQQEVESRMKRLQALQKDAAATLAQPLGGPGVPFTQKGGK